MYDVTIIVQPKYKEKFDMAPTLPPSFILQKCVYRQHTKM